MNNIHTSLNKKNKWTTITWGRAPPCGGYYWKSIFLNSHCVFAWDLLTCASCMRDRAFIEKYFFKGFLKKKIKSIDDSLVTLLNKLNKSRSSSDIPRIKKDHKQSNLSNKVFALSKNK